VAKQKQFSRQQGQNIFSGVPWNYIDGLDVFPQFGTEIMNHPRNYSICLACKSLRIIIFQRVSEILLKSGNAS